MHNSQHSRVRDDIMSTSDKICKDGVSKSSEEQDDDVCEVKDMLQKLSTDDKDVVLSICANCGKEGDDVKACTACKLVKYCNRECQIAHRPKHKKECRKRAAELHDEKLFKQPPPGNGECLICFLRLPLVNAGRRYQICCGKTIVAGVIIIMHLFMITKAIELIVTSVPTAELHSLNHKKR